MAHEGLGRRRKAITLLDLGLNQLQKVEDDVLTARIRLAKGICLQALGLPVEAKQEVAAALELAERLDQVGLLARAHRTLLMLHLWSGPAHRAWSHARAAVSLAEKSGERNVAWSAHWAAAVLAGMTSNTPALQSHLAASTKLAQELSSPLLQLRTAEIAIEYRAGIGDWDRALIDGEHAVQTARNFELTTLLARLLSWVGGLYLHRGEIATARRMFDEAWEISGAGNIVPDQPFEVHGVLPAFVARAIYLAAVGEHARAIEIGQTAIEIADRTGNMAWSVYRLLPTLAESALAIGAHEELQDFRRRLEHDAAWLSHPIGQAWVGIIDAELARDAGDLDGAIRLLQQAVGALEAVPYPFDAALTRHRLARALQQHGDVREAVREASAALQVFESLGASPSADVTRELLRTLGAHVPAPAQSTESFSTLTARELEIVKLVTQRLSNKEIGVRLGISDRTVGTHLANIYDKTGVRDRTLLGDVAREHGLHR